MNFSYVNPTKIQFGQGQISSIKELIPQDQKVLVMYGGGSIKKNGVYQQVSDALSGHQWIEFSGVEPNPTAEHLDKAVAVCKAESIEFIIAVGGGSVIDGAKYIAAAACYDGDGWDILVGKHAVDKALPIGAILTLPATGSESNSGAVITKASTRDKLSFLNPLVQPKFAVMDPDVMKTLPERQLINGLVDAWVHVCEQYLTTAAGNMVQDGYAETLLKNLLTLGRDYENHDNDQWRANLMWTANQALNGLIGAGAAHDWATHMIGHELTALYHVDHARSLAIVQPSLLRNQSVNKQQKIKQMGINVFGFTDNENLVDQTIDAMEAFYKSLGVSTQLTEMEHKGTKAEAIDVIIKQLEKHGMVALGESKAITLDVSRAILEDAVA
ncbi:iron-containing alcohol dehydrogenase [Psychromonas sp. RZ22]|uniref:iron-containing alcohol dehydrogenase n=1 Tax=Psychromonas algarum TaxID=2555643 RepID=UPI0010686FDD|nr:iron-containing alcohol dehydrogenase [Psychromonas sp. RZ22]TEW55658.1 iron-containing alcohol dehydrogenase [Psychromonas sp. RZ22]